jgi:hypothetical protein
MGSKIAVKSGNFQHLFLVWSLMSLRNEREKEINSLILLLTLIKFSRVEDFYLSESMGKTNYEAGTFFDYCVAFENVIGCLQIFSSKEEGREEAEEGKSKGNQAKELLAKYGGAYLATSITLSLISFSLCYALISAGIDVQTLLQKV